MDDSGDAGRIPRIVECELTEDLVDSTVPGDEVTVCGVVKVSNQEGDGKPRGGPGKQSLFLLYVDVVSVSNSKQLQQGKMDMVQFSVSDLCAVNEIASEPPEQLFPLIVSSLCPAMYGHETVKGS